MKACVFFFFLLLVGSALCLPRPADAVTEGTAVEKCEVRALTTAGFVCGVRGLTDDQQPFASFLAVPYAKQPVGELRFKELQAPEPWYGNLNATQPGPVCPQKDILFGPLMTPTGSSEECIHANICVPLSSLPCSQSQPLKELGLPILVFIHGGGFAFGSGDPDIYGPEYLVSNGVLVITFNCRLNVFGFLSLNSTQIPGNNGLRDMITLLRWVKDNAVYFGGNPDDITLTGQSAGAVSVHLLSMSPEANGLFKRGMLMSGIAIDTFYTLSPAQAQNVSKSFLDTLGINTTNPEEVHKLLTELPLKKLMEAYEILQDKNGVGVFFPVIESSLPGVKAILSENTGTLLENGHGKDIPLLIGFTNKEAEAFRKGFEEMDVVSRIKQNPLIMAPQTVSFDDPPEVALEKATRISKRYFQGEPTIDGYLKFYTEALFQYPALKVAKYRSKTEGAPTYMYQFSYNSTNPVKTSAGLDYDGAGHLEDLTYIFKVHSVQVKRDSNDNLMTKLMVRYVLNFMRNDRPSRFTSWPQITGNTVGYQNITSATDQSPSGITAEQSDLLNFFDGIFASR